MAAKLQAANLEALRNIVGRMLEAHGRRMWQADQSRLQRLRELYDISDRELEGVN